MALSPHCVGAPSPGAVSGTIWSGLALAGPQHTRWKRFSPALLKGDNSLNSQAGALPESTLLGGGGGFLS